MTGGGMTGEGMTGEGMTGEGMTGEGMTGEGMTEVASQGDGRSEHLDEDLRVGSRAN
jgi:hypothetical protein